MLCEYCPWQSKGSPGTDVAPYFLLVLDAFFYPFSIIWFRLSNKHHTFKKELKALPENAAFHVGPGARLCQREALSAIFLRSCPWIEQICPAPPRPQELQHLIPVSVELVFLFLHYNAQNNWNGGLNNSYSIKLFKIHSIKGVFECSLSQNCWSLQSWLPGENSWSWNNPGWM